MTLPMSTAMPEMGEKELRGTIRNQEQEIRRLREELAEQKTLLENYDTRLKEWKAEDLKLREAARMALRRLQRMPTFHEDRVTIEALEKALGEVKP